MISQLKTTNIFGINAILISLTEHQKDMLRYIPKLFEVWLGV